MFDIRLLRAIIFAWYPLSVGSIDYISEISIVASLQQWMLLFIYGIGLFHFIQKGEVRETPRFFIFYVCLVFFSVLSNFYSFKQIMMLFSLVGGISWAAMISRYISFSDLIALFAKVSNYTFVFSLIYIGVNYSKSIEYLVDGLTFSSMYEQKNTYGRFLFLGVFFNVLNYVYSGKGMLNYKLLLIIMCYLSMLFISKSKSSLFLSIVILTLIPIVSSLQFSLNYRRWMVVGFLSMTSLLTILVFSVGEVENVGTAVDCARLSQDICIPGTGRFTIWDAIFYDLDLYERYLFGFGYGVYFENFATVALTDIGLGGFVPSDPHNGYVDVLVSLGVVGLVFWLTTIIFTMILSIKCTFEVFVFTFLLLAIYLLSNVTESYFLKTTNIYPLLFCLICFYVRQDLYNLRRFQRT